MRIAKRLTWLMAVLLAAGCAAKMPPPAPVRKPVIEPDRQAAAQATLMKRFSEVSASLDAERRRADTLDKEFAAATEQLRAGRAEAEGLRNDVAALKPKAEMLDMLQTKHAELQKTLVESEAMINDLRRELMEEKMARVKSDQQVVMLKIESAKYRKRTLLEKSPGTAAATPEETMQ